MLIFGQLGNVMALLILVNEYELDDQSIRYQMGYRSPVNYDLQCVAMGIFMAVTS